VATDALESGHLGGSARLLDVGVRLATHGVARLSWGMCEGSEMGRKKQRGKE
jgi:hypothetical protein